MKIPVLHSLARPDSPLAEEHFFGWHPLSDAGLDVLAPEIREIARYAQLCLQGVHDSQLAEALAHMRRWRETQPGLSTRQKAPDVVLEEELSSHMEVGTLVDLLMTRQGLVMQPYQYAALATLKEISGLCELEVVAGKGALNAAAQYLTLKLVWLQTTTVLLRMAEQTPSQRDMLRSMMQKMFRAGDADAS